MKGTKIRRVILTLSLILVSCIISAQTAEELIQKAIQFEEVKGELVKAIEVYQVVLKDFPDNKPLAAKAQFHVGLCYEKLGVNKAQKAYKAVVENYPGQKQEVALAKERLSKLLVAENELEITPIPKFTKINIPTKLSWNVKLSPDGKELAVVSDKKLWKLPLSGSLGQEFSGTPVLLDTEEIKVDNEAGLFWSNDGKWIAFNEHPLNDTLLQKKGNQCIYVVPAEGGKPIKVIENFRAGRIENFRISLSPDGKNLAHSSFKNKEQHIFTTQVAGGSPKQLVDIQAREPVFSSDGKWIAYVEDKNFGTGGGNLWIAPASGGDSKLIASAGYVTSPVWSPDNSMIAFVDNDKKTQINVVEVPKVGQENSNVICIDAPEGMEGVSLLAGWTSDDKIGAILTKKVENAIYSLPVQGGIATEVLHDCWAMMPRWSPDGERIYYTCSEIKGSQQAFQLSLASVPAKGGSGTFLSKDNEEKNIWQLGHQGGNRISPDGKTIVSAAWQELSDINFPLVNIWKITTDGSKSEKITNKKGHYADFCPSWSPDGNKIAFIRAKIKRTRTDFLDTTRITTINSSGGEEKVLVTESDKWINSLVWSPDGKMLAYLSKEKEAPNTKYMNFIKAENGTSLLRWETSVGETNIELAWSPDSKRIAFNDRDGKVIKIMNIEDGSIEDIKTNLEDVKIGHIDWSPDGKKFVFVGSKGGNREFWLLEDFLPLDKLAQNKEAPPKTTTIEKVSSGDASMMWRSASPNGKYMTYSDPVSLNLAYRDLTNGKTKLLTNDATEEPLQFNMASVISPDSKKIAYAWYKGNHHIRLIDIDNPQPKTLYANKGEDIWPCAWSGNGNKIYARCTNTKEGTSRIISVNAQTGEMHEIMAFDKMRWLQFCISSDDNLMAFNVQNDTKGDIPGSDIHLISTNGKNETSLIKHPANDKILAWLPEKNQIIFKSNRSGTWDLWSAEIANGKIKGEPQRIFTDIGNNFSSKGFTNSGTLYYSKISRKFNAFTAPLDQSGGELKYELQKPMLGSIRNAQWSPDGKKVAIIKEFWAQGKRPIFIHDSETGNERMLSDRFIANHLLWLNDSKTLLLIGRDKQKEDDKSYSGGLYTIDVNSSVITEHNTFSDFRGKEWGIGLFVRRKLAERTNQESIFYLKNGQLVSRNLNTEEETILLKDNNFDSRDYTLEPSLGEKNLLFCNENQLFIIPVAESKLIPIVKRLTINTIGVRNNAVWSPDGKYIFYSQNSDDGSALWRISEEGENPTKVWDSKFPISSLSIHPNGQKMVITTLCQESEIWKVNNLLPPKVTASNQK